MIQGVTLSNCKSGILFFICFFSLQSFSQTFDKKTNTVDNKSKKTTEKVNDNLFSINGIVEEVQPLGSKSYIAKISGFRNAEVYIDSVNLKYPASFTVFKKGDVVVLNCKSFMIDYLNTSSNNPKINVQEFKFVKSNEEFDEICKTTFSKDSVKIENIVEFYPDKDNTLITFTLRITNLTDRFIPALTPNNNGRFFNKETGELLTEFIVNDESRGLSIYNGISQKNETLNKGGVSKISESYLLTESSNFDSDIITIQWKYKGILSKKVIVDLVKQKVIE